MATGVSGHHGHCAVAPVEKLLKQEPEFATTQPLPMEESPALGQVVKASCATPPNVLKVKNNFTSFYIQNPLP